MQTREESSPSSTVEREYEVAALLGIPAGVSLMAFVPVAYYSGATFRPAQRRPLSEVVHWNRWGGRGPHES
jgi:hypothetical protein